MAYDIDRLYVIAGPRSAGKSTFLREPSKRISVDALPEPLRQMVSDPPRLLQARQMPNERGKKLGNVLLHVDLITPLDSLMPFRLNASESVLTKQIYESWPALECIGSAKELHFVTLVLPRQVLFRRWLGRVTGDNGKHVRKNVVTIYGDSTDDAAPLRALYGAWSDFVGQFSHLGHAALDVRGEQYEFHPVFCTDLVTDK